MERSCVMAVGCDRLMTSRVWCPGGWGDLKAQLEDLRQQRDKEACRTPLAPSRACGHRRGGSRFCPASTPFPGGERYSDQSPDTRPSVGPSLLTPCGVLSGRICGCSGFVALERHGGALDGKEKRKHKRFIACLGADAQFRFSNPCV